jgi:hypothetical protein
MSSNLMEAELLFLTPADMERAIPSLLSLASKSKFSTTVSMI